MQRYFITLGSLLVLFTAGADAGDTDDLIALDKQWGESVMKGDMSVSEKLLADQVVSVTPAGVRGKKGELAFYQSALAGKPYEPTDYKVTFVNPNTAIMTHSAKSLPAHNSLHVWSRKGGKWQIVATSTTPISAGK